MHSGKTKPLHISAQTGREYFTTEQVEECLLCCKQLSQQTGISIYQETHRNKWAFAAHVVRPFLDKHPDLLLTLDVSHWFCVSESYLEDQQPAVQKAITHARHIHARVGHTEGPQVYEPSSPEYADALKAHLAVWDEWVRAVVTRAAGRIRYWEIWNEPEDSKYYSGDVATMIDNYVAVYRTILAGTE